MPFRLASHPIPSTVPSKDYGARFLNFMFAGKPVPLPEVGFSCRLMNRKKPQ